jgi:hypothetical protein
VISNEETVFQPASVKTSTETSLPNVKAKNYTEKDNNF